MRSLYKLKERGADQDLLREHVWVVWGRGDACQHDSYTCDTHPGATGWPTRRLNTTDHNFFGAVGNVVINLYHCRLLMNICRRSGTVYASLPFKLPKEGARRGLGVLLTSRRIKNGCDSIHVKNESNYKMIVNWSYC